MSTPRYFDDDGNTLDVDALWDEEGDVRPEAIYEASQFVTDESDAVRLAWAAEMANTTHGNYGASTLFHRSRPSTPVKHKRAQPTIPAEVWVEFQSATIPRYRAKWIKAVWVEQPPAHRASSCLRVAVVDSEANREEVERQAIITRALAKLTAEERAALGHGKP